MRPLGVFAWKLLVTEESSAGLVWNHVQCDAVLRAQINRCLVFDRATAREDGFDAGFDEYMRSVRKWKKRIAVRCSSGDIVTGTTSAGDSEIGRTYTILLTDTIADELAILHQSDRVAVTC